jgi:hypothetical protein
VQEGETQSDSVHTGEAKKKRKTLVSVLPGALPAWARWPGGVGGALLQRRGHAAAAHQNTGRQANDMMCIINWMTKK